MLRLSKKADYALIAMKHLALRGTNGSSSAREIAEQYDIPIELMAKVLQRLVELFRLSQPELDLLQTCLSAVVDPSIGADRAAEIRARYAVWRQ